MSERERSVSIVTVAVSAAVSAVVSAIVVAVGVVGVTLMNDDGPRHRRRWSRCRRDNPLRVRGAEHNVGGSRAARGVESRGCSCSGCPGRARARRSGSGRRCSGARRVRATGGGARRGRAGADRRARRGPGGISGGRARGGVADPAHPGDVRRREGRGTRGRLRRTVVGEPGRDRIGVGGSGVIVDGRGAGDRRQFGDDRSAATSLIGFGDRFAPISWKWIDGIWKLSNESACYIASQAMVTCAA